MAESPDRFKPRSAKAVVGMVRLGDSKSRPSGPNPYSHRRYRKYRSRVMSTFRLEDEDRIDEIYMNLDPRSFRDYAEWWASGLPLCRRCLGKGTITPARVLDHIIPIEQGGAKYDMDNHQPLCDTCHNIKRASEDKKQ